MDKRLLQLIALGAGAAGLTYLQRRQSGHAPRRAAIDAGVDVGEQLLGTIDPQTPLGRLLATRARETLRGLPAALEPRSATPPRRCAAPAAPRARVIDADFEVLDGDDR